MRPTAFAFLTVFTTAVLLTGCSSVEYRDTNDAVDARPECAGGVGRPGEPVPAWCERTQETTWSTDSDSSKNKIEFGAGDADG